METQKFSWARCLFNQFLTIYFNLVLELQFDDFYDSMLLQLHCFTACIFNRHGRCHGCWNTGRHEKKNNPKLLAFLQGKSLKLTHTSVVFDFAKMGILINLMTPDTTTYLNDLMTEWQHQWQTSSPWKIFGTIFFQVHLEHLLFLPMDPLPSKLEMHKNRCKKIRAETVDLAQPPLWSRNCLMVQSHPEKHGSTGLDVLKTLGKY